MNVGARTASGLTGWAWLPDGGLPALALGLCLGLYCLPSGPGLAGFGLVALAALYLALSRDAWRGKVAPRLAALALLFALALLGSRASEAGLWRAGLAQYRSVVALLFGIALLQRVTRGIGLEVWVRRLLAAAPPAHSGLVLLTTAMALALPLSLATVAILTGILSQVLQQPLDGARLSMRAVCLTMFLIPTTVASAAVSASLPGLSMVQVLGLGAPVVLAGVLLCIRIRPKLHVDQSGAPDGRWLMAVIAAFVLVFCLSLATGAAIPEAIGITGLALFLLDGLYRRIKPAALVSGAGAAARSCSGEVMLMLACGLLAVALSRVGGELPFLRQAVALIWSSPAMAYGVVLLLLPAITLFGVHPMILFNLVFPIVDNSLLGSTAAQYLAWVSMFVAAQLVSPVSISAILAANALGVSPAATSYRLHGRFVLGLAAFVWLYLLLTHGASRWLPG